MPSMHSSISGSVTNANIACYVRMVRMAPAPAAPAHWRTPQTTATLVLNTPRGLTLER